jgi:EmrB/QacA subfamily drug resistance transporter
MSISLEHDVMSTKEPVHKTSALLIITLVSFLTPFMGSSVNIALPSIGREFAMDAVLLSWVSTSYLLAAAVFLVPFGSIADIYGRKRVFTYGMVLYIVATLLTPCSTSAIALLCFRALHGIGSAMIFSTGIAILISVFPPEERGKALGFNVAAVYFGLSAGPFLGGALTEYFGWRSIFLATLLPCVLVVILIFTKLKTEWAEAKGEKFDLVGSLIYCSTIISIMYGFSLLPEITGAGMVSVGILGALAFVKWEMRVESPVFAIDVFRHNRVFVFSNLAAFINYSATFATGFILSLYLQYIKGLSPQNAGLILISQPLVMAVFSPFAGRLSDRIEPRIVASTGMACLVIGLLLFIFLGEGSTLIFIIATLVLHGLGFALFSSPNTNAVMSSVEKRFLGVASGTLGTMRLTGMMFSMGITMLVFALYIGKVEITPEYYVQFLKSVRVIFVIFTVLCLSGIFASLARGKVE